MSAVGAVPDVGALDSPYIGLNFYTEELRQL